MDSFTSSEEVSRPDGPDSYIKYAEMAEEQPPSGGHDGFVEAGLAQVNKEQVQGGNAEPYCAFTTRSKLFIVLTVSMASFFSPFRRIWYVCGSGRAYGTGDSVCVVTSLGGEVLKQRRQHQ